MKKVALLLLVAACLGAGGVKAETPSPEAAAASSRCEPVTGSRIAKLRDADGRCPATDGRLRSFSPEELRLTGATDLNEALVLLDPRLGLRR